MAPRYRVTLTEQEHSELEATTKRGVSHAKRVIYARALLLVDSGPAGPLEHREYNKGSWDR